MRLNDHIDEGLPRSSRRSRWPRRPVCSLELSRLHHLRGNLCFPLGRDVECLREHERALDHARSRRLARGRGGRARRPGRRLLPARAHALGERAVPHVRRARPRTTASAGSRSPTCRWSAGRRPHLNDIGGPPTIGDEAIELAVRASQPRAELLARSLMAGSSWARRDRPSEAEHIRAGAGPQPARSVPSASRRRRAASARCSRAPR